MKSIHGWRVRTLLPRVLSESLTVHDEEPGSPGQAAVIDVVLFDVGGVLVDLPGLPGITAADAQQQADLWQAWIHSPHVQQFETGKCTAIDFAQRMVAQWELPLTPPEYLEAFRSWPQGVFPEVAGIVTDLRPELTTGCLSNSNEIHWPLMWEEMRLSELLDMEFVSFRLGVAKPDPEVFARVTRELQVPPHAVFFADDNPVNVAAAQAAGWAAARTVGPGELRAALTAAGLLR